MCATTKVQRQRHGLKTTAEHAAVPAAGRAARRAARRRAEAPADATLGTNLRSLLSIRKDIFDEQQGEPGATTTATTAAYPQSCAKLASSSGFKLGAAPDSILQLLQVKQECADDYPRYSLPPPPPPPAKSTTGRPRSSSNMLRLLPESVVVFARCDVKGISVALRLP
ncbi:hypothetical protein ONE63_010506 [Megalurothrips usitatus]|uniref:Uncharacterized protein n=1 Tax=Megalurothrips usitatus TaxID=439358 RepID=A0AAV7XHR3_9NEOP|nr:hypothetical protein ONE63_010506 [Megalurothrips usitatus]